MGNVYGLNGQWMGRFDGTNTGALMLNIDELESDYDGVAYLLNDDSKRPGIAAAFTVPNKSHKFEVRTKYLLAIDPKTLEPVPLEQVQPQFGPFPKEALVRGGLEANVLQLSWKSDIGDEGQCTLNRSKASEPSELQSEKMSWNGYKQFVAELQHQRLVFRGQNEPWRLRTSYHRLGRAEMTRFVNQDMPMLYRKLSARTRHVFNIKDPDENGSFLNMVQHHGYPTPLLDWTYSPYVAAYFAYRGTSNRMADNADANKNVRIFIFDREKWTKRYEASMKLIYFKLHITIAEFSAIENERLIPQQAVTMVTNVDDVETYIKMKERESRETFLRAVDIPLSERRHVIRELNYMGITAGSMFPGLDGACEDLKERNFDF